MKVSATALIALVSLTASVVDARVGHTARASRQLKKDKDKTKDDIPVLAAEDGTPILTIVGNDGEFSVYPLGLCQGECDTDDDCAEGLMCYQREREESVPGCQDGGQGFDSRGDYCVMKDMTMTGEDMMASVAPSDGDMMGMGNATAPCTMEMMYCADGVTPMEQGPDCQWMDDMCPPPVACTLEMAYCPDGTPMERDPADCRWMEELCPATVAPTETMAPTEKMSEGIDTAIMADERVTVMPTDGDNDMVTGGDMGDDIPPSEEMPMLSVVGQDGNPAEVFPLGLCQGDCDSDAECGEGLMCLLRDRGDLVPGCDGDLDRTTDFCVMKPMMDGTIMPSSMGTAGATAVPTVAATM